MAVVEVADFEAQVLATSEEQPVLVDFWAPWCGPCRQLGPILERLAGEEGAQFTLAKVNTDIHQTVAAKYRISSIPAVKLFVDREVADEFIGALPETQVRRWLENALPSESKRRLEEAEERLEEGDEAGARSIIEDVLRVEPGNATASVLLAKLRLFEAPAEAMELARASGKLDAQMVALSQGVQAIGGILLKADVLAALPDDPARQPYIEGAAALRERNLDGALGKFVQSVRLDKRYNEEAARKACIAIFACLGNGHPLTQKHRKALEMALF
jgi:putative thioredoxin